MANGGSWWSCAPLPGRPERAGPTLTRFHRERRRGLRREGVGGRSGVHPGDRPSSRISQRWSFCRIITRLTPPNRRILSAQVRPGIPRTTIAKIITNTRVIIAQCEISWIYSYYISQSIIPIIIVLKLWTMTTDLLNYC